MRATQVAGKAGWFLRQVRRGSEHYETPYAAALVRSARLFAAHRFALKEIAGYGLYVPSIARRYPVLVGKKRSLEILLAVNREADQRLTEAKDEFHRVCRASGLPVPATYAWTKGGRRFDADGAAIDDDESWLAHLRDRLPREFIVKDRAGAYGSGFRAFRREGERFFAADGEEAWDAHGLAAQLARGGRGGVIVQERLFDAAPLAVLSGRRGLQTMRVNTLLHEDGRVSILFYMLKVLAGRTLSDNFSMGATGNLIAFGDPEAGVVRGAVNIHPCGSGMTVVAAHPQTGRPFDGFAIPYWSEAIDLAKRAQACFASLPTLGWDIALTAAGPALIEANARWDPPLYAPFLMSAENWRRVFGAARPDLR